MKLMLHRAFAKQSAWFIEMIPFLGSCGFVVHSVSQHSANELFMETFKAHSGEQWVHFGLCGWLPKLHPCF